MDKNDKRRGIQSVETGLRVLDALVDLGQPSPLGAIAQRAGLPSPQTHRYLISLIQSGMAQQDAASGRYDIGPAALRLGLGALARVDAVQMADAALSAFVQRSGRTVQIAALGPLGPTLIRWWGGRPAVTTSCTLGSVLPLITSATGQIFLAFTPESEIAPMVEEERMMSGHTQEAVTAIAAKVRATGQASVEGTMVTGLRAMGFPIFDLQGRAVFSVTTLAPAGTTLPREAETTEELGALCRQISARLGYHAA